MQPLVRDLPISAAEFKTRQTALLQELGLSDECLVAVFAEGSARGMGAKSHAALRYLLGWDGQETQSLFLLGKAGALMLLSSPFLLPMARETCPDCDIEALPPSQWPQRIKENLGANATLCTVGFDAMPVWLSERFEADCSSIQFRSADAHIERQRASKSESELATMKAGAQICDALFENLGRYLLKDQPVWKTQLRLEHEARMAGADYCKTWLTVAPQADYPRYWRKECTACPAVGDQILFGIALTVEGYWAHGIRMGSVGPLKPKHKRLWHQVHQALEVGQDRLRPQSSLSLVDVAMSQCLVDPTLGEAHKTVHRFRNGHGLGLSYEEPLVTDNFLQLWGGEGFAEKTAPEQCVAKNSVFELHPNLFVPELGGAALGDMFWVSPTKTQRLLHFPLSPFEIELHAS